MRSTLDHSTRSSTVSDDHCRDVGRSTLTRHTNAHQHSVPISTISEIDHQDVGRSTLTGHTNAHQHSTPSSTVSDDDCRDVGKSRHTGHTIGLATTTPDHHPYAPPSLMLVILIVPQRGTPSIRITSINDGESGWDIIYRLRPLARSLSSQWPTLCATRSLGFRLYNRPSRLGGSTELTCQALRLVCLMVQFSGKPLRVPLALLLLFIRRDSLHLRSGRTRLRTSLRHTPSPALPAHGAIIG